MWTLRTIDEDEPERTLRILPGRMRTVGRGAGADFIVDAPLVSRVHCRLTALPEAGSTWSTWRAPTARSSRGRGSSQASVISVAFGGKDKKTLYVLARGAKDASGAEVANAAQVHSIQMVAQGYRGRAK